MVGDYFGSCLVKVGEGRGDVYCCFEVEKVKNFGRVGESYRRPTLKKDELNGSASPRGRRPV